MIGYLRLMTIPRLQAAHRRYVANLKNAPRHVTFVLEGTRSRSGCCVSDTRCTGCTGSKLEVLGVCWETPEKMGLERLE